MFLTDGTDGVKGSPEDGNVEALGGIALNEAVLIGHARIRANASKVVRRQVNSIAGAVRMNPEGNLMAALWCELMGVDAPVQQQQQRPCEGHCGEEEASHGGVS